MSDSRQTGTATPATIVVVDDADRYRAISARDARFDGVFVVGVTSTGIYCRPSCPARAPAFANVRFHPTAAAAQAAGFRACKRCRPDASPGSPEWDVRADVAGRAMRLIADGVVDRVGVGGLARRLAYSERHVTRTLTDVLGAGPLALARAQRAQTARTLIETTTLPFADVAFAAGFASVRQFNSTIHDVFVSSPTELRHQRRRDRDGRAGCSDETSTSGGLTLRLAVRAPFDGAAILGFLGARCVTGTESFDGAVYARSMRLPHGDAVARLASAGDHVTCRLRLADLRDLQPAVERCRRLLDLDADPVAVEETLAATELADLVAKRPGLRVPRAVDGFEMAVRAVLGQQVSVAGAATLVGRLVAAAGAPLAPDLVEPGIHATFPDAAAVASAVDDGLALGIPGSRTRTLGALARAARDGAIVLDPGADRDAEAARLLELRGIGPWTVDYVRMRGLCDPDAFLPTDLGVKHALGRLGLDASASDRWRPWRSYALIHLWSSL